MFDSRKDFNESWLSESPEGVGALNTNYVVNDIYDRIDSGSEVQEFNNIKYIDGVQTALYWIEQNGEIILAVEFTKRQQALIVNGVYKKYKGKAPYASDLYMKILKKSDIPIRIMSDDRLSDEGFKLWERMLKNGYKISVYSKENPGQSFVKKIETVDELKNYFKKDDYTFRQWQFVLSEGINFQETISFFGTRRMRELSGQGVD